MGSKPLFFRELTPRLLRIFLFASVSILVILALTKMRASLANALNCRLEQWYVTLEAVRILNYARNFGYDNNWWAGVIGQQSFINDYGRYNGPGQDRSLPSTWLSAASGTPIAGWIIGCVLAGYLTSTFGRKMTIITICVVALIGMVIQAAVLNYWVLMVGRLINAFSMGMPIQLDDDEHVDADIRLIGIEANCVPMYMAELAPASIRGGLVNFYQSWLYIGAALAAITVYASSITLTGTWSYRTAIVAQIGPPCMLLAAIWFIPESPRWLLGKGRKEEAMKALAYMRAGAATEEEVATELNLIDLAMQEERENNLATSYADCFKGTNLRRTIIAIGVQVLQQAQGNSFTTTYLVIFLKQVGVKEPLLINVAKMCCNFGATLLTFFLTDMLGRRPMLMGGSFFMAGLMWTVSGVSAWSPGGPSNTAAQGVVAAILLYGAFAAACWGSVMWTVTTTMLGFVTSLLITYINPFVQNEPGYLGAKVGMIYGSISVLALIFVFLVVPEMSGRSLEELDELFRAKVPAWKSKDYVCTGIGTQITHIQNIEGKRVSIDRAQSVSREAQGNDVKK
ncbi:unnamed protein product [Clonostachys byssicola]|uniref:Major facilitator superfamily (MFS) profile domain-containing protein n=1 Tax=Clonostachys byssicola TaxID=160290 RepID=A0A9N9U1W1_9HYPO|nr:unnamed protein product [Clonostachys byssicola]